MSVAFHKNVLFSCGWLFSSRRCRSWCWLYVLGFRCDSKSTMKNVRKFIVVRLRRTGVAPEPPKSIDQNRKRISPTSFKPNLLRNRMLTKWFRKFLLLPFGGTACAGGEYFSFPFLIKCLIYRSEKIVMSYFVVVILSTVDRWREEHRWIICIKKNNTPKKNFNQSVPMGFQKKSHDHPDRKKNKRFDSLVVQQPHRRTKLFICSKTVHRLPACPGLSKHSWRRNLHIASRVRDTSEISSDEHKEILNESNVWYARRVMAS